MQRSTRDLGASAPLWLMVFSLTLLAGCGFHLRTEESLTLSPALSPMQISGIPTSDPLYSGLSSALREAGVSVADSAATAQTFLVLSGRENRRRVLAVNEAGKAIEYEMVEAVTFSLLDRDRNVILPEYRVVNTGSYTDPTGDPLGKAGEQALLRGAARRNTVEQIMVRLRFGTR